MGTNARGAVTTAGVTLILVVPVLLLATLFVREGIEATRNVQASMAAGDYGWFGRRGNGLLHMWPRRGLDVDLPGLVRRAPAGSANTWLRNWAR